MCNRRCGSPVEPDVVASRDRRAVKVCGDRAAASAGGQGLGSTPVTVHQKRHMVGNVYNGYARAPVAVEMGRGSVQHVPGCDGSGGRRRYRWRLKETDSPILVTKTSYWP